ncbi:VOC family protein [Janibacter limosus]|uniref:VOC family protein n=1 Tax=Janibacter limosus TaxID=53458 RepID=A0AC61U3B2_9MICO|nr:VOC family protein [Janibacter limosus]UUZ44514.1 VOC family protein [Janibacter limosus]
MGMTLRIEIFPADIEASLAFYTALGFEVVGRKEGPPYASIVRDEVRIGMVQSHAQPSEHRAVPTGTEIVLGVDDVRAERDRLVAAGIELAEDLQDREWGLTDVRVHDPDGYYLRITDRR